ncbi:MAG: hypothetical protein ACFB00_06430 [Parvularculaceae bacterium]
MYHADRHDPADLSDAAFDAALAARYRRLSMLTLDLAEEAGAAARSVRIAERGDKTGAFERRVAAMSRAIRAHQLVERLRAPNDRKRRAGSPTAKPEAPVAKRSAPARLAATADAAPPAPASEPRASFASTLNEAGQDLARAGVVSDAAAATRVASAERRGVAEDRTPSAASPTCAKADAAAAPTPNGPPQNPP